MKLRWLGFWVILLAGSGMGAWAVDEPKRGQPVDSGIPDVLYEIGAPDQPVFFRLEALRQPDGSLDTTKLPYLVRRQLESEVDPSAECTQLLGPVPEVYAEYRPSLAQALQSADWVFVAEVEASAQGILGTTEAAGTLLEVSPTEVLQGPSWYESRYIFIPIAEFSLGGHDFCAVDEFHAPLPKVGERVLLLADLHRWNRERKILETGSFTGIITLPRYGRVGLPERYRSSDPMLQDLHSDSFVDWVRSTIEKGAP